MRASTVREFLTFARSLERDKPAIVAGLTLPYSTGPVEGHINRLKLIKRQAYGRAELSYLQHRFAALCLTDKRNKWQKKAILAKQRTCARAEQWIATWNAHNLDTIVEQSVLV